MSKQFQEEKRNMLDAIIDFVSFNMVEYSGLVLLNRNHYNYRFKIKKFHPYMLYIRTYVALVSRFFHRHHIYARWPITLWTNSICSPVSAVYRVVSFQKDRDQIFKTTKLKKEKNWPLSFFYISFQSTQLHKSRFSTTVK